MLPPRNPVERRPPVLFADLAFARRFEFADAALAADCARAYARRHPDAGAAVQSLAGGQAVYAGPDSPITQVIAPGMQGPITSVEFDRLEQFFQSRRAPVNIELCPLAHPSLFTLLAERPYRIAEQSNVLYRTIDPSQRPPSHDRSIQVRPVTSGEVGAWADTLVRGFVGSDDAPRSILDLVASSLDAEGVTGLLATIDGRPVGGGSVGVRDRVALLFGHSTLPQYRQRGVQGVVIAVSLGVAISARCNLSVVCTLPGAVSQRNAERHAFHVAYTRTKVTRVG